MKGGGEARCEYATENANDLRFLSLQELGDRVLGTYDALYRYKMLERAGHPLGKDYESKLRESCVYEGAYLEKLGISHQDACAVYRLLQRLAEERQSAPEDIDGQVEKCSEKSSRSCTEMVNSVSCATTYELEKVTETPSDRELGENTGRIRTMLRLLIDDNGNIIGGRSGFAVVNGKVRIGHREIRDRCAVPGPCMDLDSNVVTARATVTAPNVVLVTTEVGQKRDCAFLN